MRDHYDAVVIGLGGIDSAAAYIDQLLPSLMSSDYRVIERRQLDRRLFDYVLSFGERMSARVFAAALRKGGRQATPGKMALGLQVVAGVVEELLGQLKRGRIGDDGHFELRFQIR